ncbi:MAG: hypothetical protein IJH20_03950 [Bacilli bacterium]|nr:hypothetical protein [Bacilli bacterium]
MAQTKKTKNELKETELKTYTGFSFMTEVILVYLIPILGFIFSFMDIKKYSERVKFLYNQSGAIFLIEIVLIGLEFIPIVRWFFYMIHLVLFVIVIITIIKAKDGEDYKIPGIYDLANLIWGKKEEK